MYRMLTFNEKWTLQWLLISRLQQFTAFSHSLKKYLLSFYHVPGGALDTGDKVMNKIEVSALKAFVF